MGDRGYFIESSNDAIEVKKKLLQAFIGRCSSFDTIARTECSLKLFLSIFNLHVSNEHLFNTSMMQNFGLEDLSKVQSQRNFLNILFEWKWLLIGVRGFICHFTVMPVKYS